jgi:hypothetical protein
MSRPKIRIYVIGDEEDAAILRCVIHHCGWCEPSGKVQACRAAFIITGTLKSPIAEAATALQRARGIPRGETGNLPVIVLHRGDQGTAMATESLKSLNVNLRGRLLLREWDHNWAELLECARVLTAKKRGPRKVERQ